MAAAVKPENTKGQSHAEYCPKFSVRVAHLGQRFLGPLEHAVHSKTHASDSYALGQRPHGAIWFDRALIRA
jgi:hypothetical protein